MRFRREETTIHGLPPQMKQTGIGTGVVLTAISAGVILVLFTATFVLDWLRTPGVSLSATPLVLSPNGDLDHDAATITYNLGEETQTTIRVLGPAGNVVRTLAYEEMQPAGQHFVTWDGRDDLGQAVEDGRYRVEVGVKGTVRTNHQTITLDVDTEPPKLQLVNLQDSLRVNTPDITIQGVTDPDSIVMVEGINQPVTVDVQGRFLFQRKLAEGDNALTVTSIDQAGNATTLTRSIALVTQGPEVTITAPEDEVWTNEAVLAVRGEAVPGSIVKVNGNRVQVRPDGSFEYDVLLNEGDNVIRVEATDDVGNISTQERAVHLKSKGPVVTLSIPDGAVLNDTTLQLTGQTEAGAEVMVNGEQMNLSAQGEFQTTINLYDGENVIEVQARDLAGNVTEMKRRVRFETPRPESDFDRIMRNIPRLPVVLIPALLLLPLFLAVGFYWARPASLVLSVDRQEFRPGLPGEGKMLVLTLELSKGARTSLEVLDRYGRPLTTIMHNRRRPAGEHQFFWDGYDDFGRAVQPGEYAIRAVAKTSSGTVMSMVHVHVVEDALVHNKVAGRYLEHEGEVQIIDGRRDFSRRRPRRSIPR